MADLRAIARALYGLPLDEFISSRDGHAQKAAAEGDKALGREIKSLRKPHAAAWAMNLMVREREETVLEIIGLGERLREAQTSSDGAAIRYLDLVRRHLMERTLSEAAELAEHHDLTLSRPAKQGLEGTLWAMMSNPTVADAVQNGLLISPIRAGDVTVDEAMAGVGPLPDSESSAVPRSTPRRPRKQPSGHEVAEAREAVEVAQEVARAAKRERKQRAKAKESKEGERADLIAQVAELREQIEATEAALDLNKRQLKDAGQGLRDAERDAARAERVADRAQDRLKRLR
jgi:hypothetical protein